VSFEGGQGPEEAAVPHMDGRRCYGMEMNVEMTKNLKAAIPRTDNISKRTGKCGVFG